MRYERESAAALEAAAEASRVILDHYARFEVIPDAPASISTDADRDAQECILQCLRRHFPGDAFCAEETTESLRETATGGPRLWVVDPIDGTRGFARKNGEFSAMIAFVERGRVAVGVVAEPARARLTYAIRDGGCWRRAGTEVAAARCRVSNVRTPAEATLTQSRSRTPGKPSGCGQALTPAHVVETYSAGIKLALVARGEADVYLNTYDQFHDWDICAGHILVEEAGGQVTDLSGNALVYGKPGAWQRHGLLATNGLLHQAALAAMTTGSE
jgi:3'(2'), 5'-bisphosphate nucleotidase